MFYKRLNTLLVIMNWKRYININSISIWHLFVDSAEIQKAVLEEENWWNRLFWTCAWFWKRSWTFLSFLWCFERGIYKFLFLVLWNIFKIIMSFFPSTNDGLFAPLFWPFKRQPHKMVKHAETIYQQQPSNCLSVFNHSVGLALKGLTA